jgi:hypothetical protein
LVRLVFENEVGIGLPMYGPITADDLAATIETIKEHAALPPWRLIKPPYRAFDVVTMYRRTTDSPHRLVRHVGVMIGARKLLHVEQECDTVKADIDDPWMRGRIAGVYRHEALA